MRKQGQGRLNTMRIQLFFMLMFVGIVAFPQKKYKHYKNTHALPQKRSQGKSATVKPTTQAESRKAKALVTPKAEEIPYSWNEPDFLSMDSTRKLKAILIVGYVEESTPSYIEEQQEVARFLRHKGVHVVEFYSPKDIWSAIVDSAKDAHILLYDGHGNLAGDDYPSGFSLSGGAVTAFSINQELKLHPNALILFNHVCYGAGSSASDTQDIGIMEACRRVGIYAHPFIDLKAGCYYANNYTGSMVDFLELFLKKKTAKVIMEEQGNRFSEIKRTEVYSFNKSYRLSVSSSTSTGKSIQTTYINGVKSVKELDPFPNYDIAMVAKPNYSVLDLFMK